MPAAVAARVAAWERFRAPWPVQRAFGPLSVLFGPGTPLLISARIALGADLDASPLTWVWTDITDYVRYASGITATTGRQDEASRTTPGTGRLVLDNRDGRFSRKNPMGPYWGLLTRNTPIWVTVDPGTGQYDLLRMFVNEWPARFDPTSTDHYVPLQCGGILRRLNSGAVLKSSLYRTLSGLGPIAYWPCEDGSAATQFASAVDGVNPMMFNGFDLGADSTLDGSGSLPTFTTGCNSAGYMPLGVDVTSTGFSAVWVFKMNSAPGVHLDPLTVYTTGTSTAWAFGITPGSPDTVDILAYSATGQILNVTTPLTVSSFYGTWHLYMLDVRQSGSNINYQLYVRSASATYSISGTLNSYTHGNIRYVATQGVSASSGAGFGHLALLSSRPSVETLYTGLTAWDGELAGARLLRVCVDEGVSITVPDAANTAAMGPQRVAKLIDTLRDCESADLGVLYEDGFGLAYQSRAQRYNAPVAMTVDFTSGALGSNPPEPTDDDQRLRNAWSVSRTSGSKAVSEDATSIANDGRHEDTATVNVHTDDQLQDVADWLVHVGTADEPRWPSLPLRLDNTAGRALIPTWVGLPYGCRITVTNPPYQVHSDPVDAFVEGKTETVTQFTWTASLNTTPAQPFEVLQLEALANRSRLDLSQTLTAALDSTSTSFQATTPGSDPLLTTTASDLPFDINVDGERMTVTNVTGASSPQTVTATRSVNAVVKSHNAGASVRLWKPGGLAL